jgi:pSer/pThr/pTyr-binding forkhead associated (FHA) protein
MSLIPHDETVVRKDQPLAREPEGGCQLVVIEGPSRGKILDLGSTAVRIGRLMENELVLASPSVSKHHAVIEPKNGNHRIKDLGSTNGVMVNGSRVSGEAGQTLVHGDSISIGDSILLYRRGGGAVEKQGLSTISLDVAKVREEAERLLREVPVSRPTKKP